MPGSITVPIETGTDELLARLDSNVAIITLNRPEARNALSDRLTPAFRKLLPTLAEDPDARCLLVTGAGTSFCAGGDVKGMAPPGRENAAALTPSPTKQERINELRDRQITLTGGLYDFPKPTLAALPGPAAGAGFRSPSPAIYGSPHARPSSRRHLPISACPGTTARVSS